MAKEDLCIYFNSVAIDIIVHQVIIGFALRLTLGYQEVSLRHLHRGLLTGGATEGLNLALDDLCEGHGVFEHDWRAQLMQPGKIVHLSGTFEVEGRLAIWCLGGVHFLVDEMGWFFLI